MSFKDPEACSKVVYLVAQEMNENMAGGRSWGSLLGEPLHIRRGKYDPVEADSQELYTVSYTQTS